MPLAVSVIIVNYNKLPYTKLCLWGMLNSRPRPAQIICIDNGSTDGTTQYLDKDFAAQAQAAGVDYTFILNDSNVGACTARNQGLEVARHPLVAFCDNDLAVRTANWLQVLQESLAEQPMNGIVGPKLVFPFAPYDIECAGAAISRTGRVQYRGRGERIDAPEFNEPREVQCLTSACWLMRKQITDTLGGLDEVFNPAQFEDFDLCYRARAHGWKVLYQPRAEMYHYENVTTSGSADVKFKYVTMRNWAEFKRRWRHVFAQEDGPPDEKCQWAKLETRSLEQTGVPPIV